jgi:hypothetical protein
MQSDKHLNNMQELQQGTGGLVDARAFIHADTPLSTAAGGTPPSRLFLF